MAVLRGSKICLGTLNIRLPGLNTSKTYQKLDFMASLELKRVYLMKNEIILEP